MATSTNLKVGFTGTQKGIDQSQTDAILRQLRAWAHRYQFLEIHHGDCIGADTEFHRLCLGCWPHDIQVILHPPSDSSKRGFNGSPQQIDLPALPYIDRNHAIVDSVDCMLATPHQSKEIIRSGTWATIRYARRQNRPLKIICPESRSSSN